MWIPKAQNRLARQGAATIFAAFEDYEREFRTVTRRAKVRFEQRDWHGLQQDALERLDLYQRVIARCVVQIRELLDFSEKDKKLWATMKSAYTELIDCCHDIELAETFFNSVSRRIFTTIGVDPRIEFLFSDFDAPMEAYAPPIFVKYPASGSLDELIIQVLMACEFAAPYQDLKRDAERTARAIEHERQEVGHTGPIDAIDLIPAVFYRNQGAVPGGQDPQWRANHATDPGTTAHGRWYRC